MTVILPDTYDSVSTQRCDIVLSRLAESTSDSTHEMASCPWMSCRTWWRDNERPFPVEYSTTPPVYAEPSSTGNVSGVVCSPWLTHWVCLPSSSPTVQQTSSGQSWLKSSVPTTLTAGLPEPRLSSTTQPSQTGSSTTESLSSSKPLEVLELLTTIYSLSGSTEAALISMTSSGYPTHQMWSSLVMVPLTP